MADAHATERRGSSGLSAATVGWGMAAGIGLGSLLGTALGDVPVGIGTGIGLGLAAAMAVDWVRGRRGIR